MSRRHDMARRLLQLLAILLVAFVFALVFAGGARAQDGLKPPGDAAEQLKVTDPYLELRTGPGRGYPVFFVVGREEWVGVELRFTDWYKVRAAGGQVGWVHRRQLQTTLTAAGATREFRDPGLDDYLQRRFEAGAAWGRFKSEPMLKLWGGWRFADALQAELTLGQVQGRYSGTDYWHVGLNVEPWSDQRLSPFLGIGFGRFRNVPNLTLVDAQATDSKLAHATVGVRWHLGERYLLRADYTLYNAFVGDNRSTDYRAFTAGIGFFF